MLSLSRIFRWSVNRNLRLGKVGAGTSAEYKGACASPMEYHGGTRKNGDFLAAPGIVCLGVNALNPRGGRGGRENGSWHVGVTPVDSYLVRSSNYINNSSWAI